MFSKIQQAFFDELIAAQNEVSVYLKNGIKLNGKIMSATGDVIVLGGAVPQMVYKDSVSTVITSGGSKTGL